MAFNPTPSRLEGVFIQRDARNEFYEQINISGSDLIVYFNSEGKLDADKISTWADIYNIGGGDSTFDGNRPIKRTPYIGLNVGGETVTEFLEGFFFPYLIAEISINSGTSYYETGSSQTITISGSITANNETVFSSTGSVKRDGVDWDTFPSASTYSVSDSVIGASGVTGHTYRAYMWAGNDGNPLVVTSSLKTVNFIYPYLYGTSATGGLSGTSLYGAMTKSITVEGTKLFTYSGTAVYIYFCYPDSYDALASIKDPNLFEIISSFTYLSSVSVTSTGLTSNWTRNYKVYRTTLQSNPSGIYTFTPS